jgi:rubrerythrin
VPHPDPCRWTTRRIGPSVAAGSFLIVTEAWRDDLSSLPEDHRAQLVERTRMSDKPSYLGLLNAIALNETRAYEYLQVWIGVTPDPDVRRVLRTVAAREGEHGMAFAKRINELGFEVREHDDRGLQERIPIAGSTEISDVEKFERFGLHELAKLLCYFDDVFKDHSIDIPTGELLGRYIAEEQDSCRMLRSCYDQLVERAEATRRAVGA